MTSLLHPLLPSRDRLPKAEPLHPAHRRIPPQVTNHHQPTQIGAAGCNKKAGLRLTQKASKSCRNVGHAWPTPKVPWPNLRQQADLQDQYA
ncbi:hypothetical protein MML48_1g17593 [Holotrichia oblita]|uniref:Uncharacterized protein n=1 Tax=Holotrichia oblita TaxID=644536 RepID=A0ACB9TY99_HOLOL|nr:hypothetical protein MML48_1g17593 [Holotrichia oblita]